MPATTTTSGRDGVTTTRRLVIALVELVAVPVVLGLALVVTVITAMGSCGGDGGEPYYDPDSAWGRFCESSSSDTLFEAMVLVPPVLSLVVGIVAVVRGSWGWMAGSLLAPLAVVIVGLVVVGGLGG